MLPGLDLHRFVDSATHFAHEAMKREGAETTGGYFCVADKDTGTPLLTFVVGSPKVGTGTRHNAQEKCLRIAQNAEHISSWQSRDTDLKKYGGGIRIKDYIIAYSGDKEHFDEAICIAVAKELGRINIDTALAIMVISQNPHWNLYAGFKVDDAPASAAARTQSPEDLNPEWLTMG